MKHKPRVVRGWLCKIDWDFELGEACGGTTIYPSLKNLKENEKCWKEEGYVQVEIREAKK